LSRGYTEQCFLEKLLTEIFSSRDIAIEIKSISGGSKKSAIKISDVKSVEYVEGVKYYVLIYNCGGDSNVKSYILDHRLNLIKAGYTKIVGLRDLYPDFKIDEINRLKQGLNYNVPQKNIKIQFVLSVMEIESWFIAEYTHFPKIDSLLTTQYLEDNFGLYFGKIKIEEIQNAAETLDNIYKAVGKRYDKKGKSINRTISHLDYSKLYFDLRFTIESLNDLVESFEEIFE
jgi:hypothetical protein